MGFRGNRHPKHHPAPSCSSGCPLRQGTASGELLGAAQRHAAPAASFHQGRAGEEHRHPKAAEPPGTALKSSASQKVNASQKRQARGQADLQQSRTPGPGAGHHSQTRAMTWGQCLPTQSSGFRRSSCTSRDSTGIVSHTLNGAEQPLLTHGTTEHMLTKQSNPTFISSLSPERLTGSLLLYLPFILLLKRGSKVVVRKFVNVKAGTE